MSKALRIIGVILVILIVGAGVMFAQATYRFDLAFNPVVSQIRTGSGTWGEMIELTPKPFSVGNKKTDVVDRLNRAGFTRVEDENVWARYEGKINNGYELYLRAGNTWVCNISYYSFIKFDANGRLASAKGTVHEHGCL